MNSLISMAERDWLPDAVIRLGIRRLLAGRRAGLDRGSESTARVIKQLGQGPIAVATDTANEQHYEAPTAFFQQVLGPRLKYSCCLFDEPSTSLAMAEEAMLRLTAERAELRDGMSVLELGCGWGSLTLWMAENFPNCRITAVSNSATQQRYITAQATERGLDNVSVIKADMRDFATASRFDRVISIEMFEHMRNYSLLFEKVANWLRPSGRAFVHVFCHRDTPYLFETTGDNDWMARHFFTGGVMPSEHLFGHFDQHLSIEHQWRVDGLHYWRTCEAWLSNLDRSRESLLRLFERDLPRPQAKVALQRWRMFFLACAELFRFGNGAEWFVGHYLLAPRPRNASAVLAGESAAPGGIEEPCHQAHCSVQTAHQP